MRLTRAGEYAIRCMLFLYKQEFRQLVSKKEIAAEMDIPEHFLAKVAKQLARKNYLEIIQGSRGGYRVVLSPKDLTLLQVIEAVEGEIFLKDCLMRSDFCFRTSYCPVRRVWQKARQNFRQILQEADFAALVNEENCLLKEIEKNFD